MGDGGSDLRAAIGGVVHRPDGLVHPALEVVRVVRGRVSGSGIFLADPDAAVLVREHTEGVTADLAVRHDVAVPFACAATLAGAGGARSHACVLHNRPSRVAESCPRLTQIGHAAIQVVAVGHLHSAGTRARSCREGAADFEAGGVGWEIPSKVVRANGIGSQDFIAVPLARCSCWRRQRSHAVRTNNAVVGAVATGKVAKLVGEPRRIIVRVDPKHLGAGSRARAVRGRHVKAHRLLS
jgi:hypothetical protein